LTVSKSIAHLRLAIVTPRFWPLVGDIPAHLLQLCDSLIALGHEPTVVTPRWQRSWPQQMMIGSLPLVRLRGSVRGGWSTLRWMYSLAGWLREQGGHLDAILVAGLKQEAYVALGTAGRTGITTILLAGEDDLQWQQTATLGARVAARCREACTIVAPTDQVAHMLFREGFANKCVVVIPRTAIVPPVCSAIARDAARTALATANYDLVTANHAQVALAVGRLDAAHRFGDLVRAWRIVTARRAEARLWIVGDGPDREALYQQIGDLDQRFRALLPGTFDCLDELLQASDMLLVPAPHASPPQAMLQALACGLPVVAADGPAIRALISHEESGFIYTPGDIKALAAGVCGLIDRPGTAIAYGSAARAVAQSRAKPADEAQAYIDLIHRQRR
jgi:glycosyltransferase involved in cell wall biosynthesis